MSDHQSNREQVIRDVAEQIAGRKANEATVTAMSIDGSTGIIAIIPTQLPVQVTTVLVEAIGQMIDRTMQTLGYAAMDSQWASNVYPREAGAGNAN